MGAGGDGLSGLYPLCRNVSFTHRHTKNSFLFFFITKSLITEIGSLSLPAFLISGSAFFTPASHEEPTGCPVIGSFEGTKTDKFAKLPIGT